MRLLLHLQLVRFLVACPYVHYLQIVPQPAEEPTELLHVIKLARLSLMLVSTKAIKVGSIHQTQTHITAGTVSQCNCGDCFALDCL